MFDDIDFELPSLGGIDLGDVNWIAFVALAGVGVFLVSIATREANIMTKIIAVAVAIIGAFIFAKRLGD